MFIISRKLRQIPRYSFGDSLLTAVHCRCQPLLVLSLEKDKAKILLPPQLQPKLCSPLQQLYYYNIRSCTMQNQQVSTLDDDGETKPKPEPTMSKRALKRQARTQYFKDVKRQKRAKILHSVHEEAGYNLAEFDKTSYYFENGLRKVYPYYYVFATYAKGRWVGRTLKNVLEKEFGFDDPADVDKAFHQGKIQVNHVQVSVDYTVKDCDFISHQIHRHENPVTDFSLEILADTNDVVVINKPSSIPCHPCGRYRFNSVVFILGKEMGYSNLRNIYRLDRLTSGVLVLGKTATATKKLEDQVANRQVEKEYVCRVVGEFPSETVTVDQPLEALSNKLRLQVVSPTGKSSQTTFTRLSYNGRSSVVRCAPKTGRTHQIRVHLQFLGHPIINDVFYNSNAWGPNKAKGGVYEIATETVCATILKRHQATQWEGGENPLFHDKLKEMQEKEEQQQQTAASIITQDEPSSSDVILQGSSTNENVIVKDKEKSNETDTTKDVIKSSENSLTSDELEKQEISDFNSNADCEMTTPESVRNGKDDSKNCAQFVDNDIDIAKHSDNDKDGDNAKNTSTHGDVQSKEVNSNTNNTVKEDSSSTTATSTSTSANTTPIADESPKETQQTRLGFDWTKWQVDAACDMCRKLTLDPKPRDLVMFLHALKYKGPDWGYQTELPDWAREDWQDEDQYMLEEPTEGPLPNDEKP